ncbi:undecaprenyl/decaprenyl-phosphate alpha-N-acetylglucosaminyl 1-phosphate transferase [Candidatus Dojkabacteria bacterium]|nr:undecaprenyl/decaprenyl-phosphate alpha-N-acetylglucosaminyl 1-phosphate transferase [Candidatus Dojkabacteria bacterium]
MFNLNIPENYQKYLDYLPLLAIGFLSGLVLTPIVGYIARKFKILAYPPSMREGNKASDFRHLEKPPTPRLGGAAVVLPFILLTLITLEYSPEVLYLVLATSLLLVMGILDDKFEFSYKFQLTAQIAAAIIIALSPINLSFINNPINGVINLDLFTFKTELLNIPIELVLPGDLLFIAWTLICINAVKFVAGTDGLMEGNSIIASLTLFLFSVRTQSDQSATLSIIFAGLALGFLIFNFYPAKIFSGSSGKSVYGFVLAVLSVMSGAKIAIGLIILMLPLIDFVWVIASRIIKTKTLNPSIVLSISDKTHLHHKMLDLGLTEPQLALVEYGLSAILGAVALASFGAMRAFSSLIALLLIVVFIGAITQIVKRRQKPSQKEVTDKESPESKYSY